MIEARVPEHKTFATNMLRPEPTAPREGRNVVAYEIGNFNGITYNGKLLNLRPGIFPKLKGDIQEVVSEAVTNAFLHGYTTPISNDSAPIVFSLAVVTEPPEQRGNLLVCIGDHRSNVGEKPSNPENGKGIILMDELASQTGYSNDAELLDNNGKPVETHCEKVVWVEFGPDEELQKAA